MALKVTIAGQVPHLPPLDPREQIVSKPLTGSSALLIKPDVGQVLLYAPNSDKLSVLTDLGDLYPAITSGYGGFETTPIPKKKPIAKWTGYTDRTWDIDLRFDNLAAGLSVESACQTLDALAGRGAKSLGGQPPAIAIDTAGVMSDDAKTFPDSRWVIQDIDWHEEETITNAAGNRMLVLATVSVLLYNTDQYLKTVADRAARTTGPSGVVHTIKARADDSLQSIARRYLGDAGKWTTLAKLNPSVRDPRKLTTGQSIRVPK